jgi:hypothetical protein
MLLGWCWKPYDESLEVWYEEAEDQLRWVRGYRLIVTCCEIIQF